MKKYKNLGGNSGVTGYQSGEDYIRVVFNNEAAYLYTYASAGKKAIEKMKLLAKEGRGLSTYISRNVKEKFAEREDV